MIEPSKLPPIEVKGVPTPIAVMSTIDLHTFAVKLLKRLKLFNIQFSTPRPDWWPQDLPFRNLDYDPRLPSEKARVIKVIFYISLNLSNLNNIF